MLQCSIKQKLLLLRPCFYCVLYQSTFQNQTLYEVLSIKPSASQEEIRTAFLKKSKQLHPDTTASGGRDTHQEFVSLNEAYSILSKPILRQQYDLKLRQHGVLKSKSSNSAVYRSHRSADFRNPYYDYDDSRRNTDQWSDYYSSGGRKRAKYRMEQDIDDEFWQEHWKFSKEHGGGGPNMATHDQSNMMKKFYLNKDLRFMFYAVVIIIVLSICMLVFSKHKKKDLEQIQREYHVWLLEKYRFTEVTSQRRIKNSDHLEFDYEFVLLNL